MPSSPISLKMYTTQIRISDPYLFDFLSIRESYAIMGSTDVINT